MHTKPGVGEGLLCVFNNNIVLSPSVVSDSFWPPWTVYPTRFLCPWDFPGKSTGVGSYYLLQGIKLITYNKLSNHSGQNGGTSYWIIGCQCQSTLSTRLRDMELGSLQPTSQLCLLGLRGSCLWWGQGRWREAGQLGTRTPLPEGPVCSCYSENHPGNNGRRWASLQFF